MQRIWIVTLNDIDYEIRVRRSIFGFVRAWVNGQKVAWGWWVNKKGNPLSIPLGEKAVANFSALSDWAYAYSLKLSGRIIYPKTWSEVEIGFTVPLAMGARLVRVLESLIFLVFIVILIRYPVTDSDSSKYILLSVLTLPILINLGRILRTFFPIEVNSQGIGRAGFELPWQDINRIGLDNQGSLVLSTDYSSLTIPAWFCNDSPTLAALVSEKTGLKQCRLVPVFVAKLYKYSIPLTVGMGAALVCGLLWVPWWVMAAGSALGMVIGTQDVNNLLMGPHRQIYSLSGLVFFCVPLFLRYVSSSIMGPVGIGLLFFLLASQWGVVASLRLFQEDLEGAMSLHGLEM